MSTDKAMETDANLRSIIHNALIDGPLLEDDTTAAFNGLVELLHDRISAALAQAEQPVAWLVKIFTDTGMLLDTRLEFVKPVFMDGRDAEFVPLFAHPPAKREAGETLKPRDNVVVDSVFGPVGGIIVEPVEGWWKVQFRDGSIAVVRPSSIRAALEASHE